jgi:DNA-binding response OmpR family regulator
MRILVVEDERKIASFVQQGLKEFGFAADVIHRGDEALEVILDNRFDAVVLDIMLPGRDGLSVLRMLRERSNAVPVLILTARGEIYEKVEGLDLGADDYLAKPFSIEELAARLRALIRRQTGENLGRYRIGDLTLDVATRIASRGNRRINLTGREFSLLECMMRLLDGPVRDTFLSRC